MNKRLWIWITVILAVFALAITALELISEQDYKKSRPASAEVKAAPSAGPAHRV